jgi:hypothetical protein
MAAVAARALKRFELVSSRRCVSVGYRRNSAPNPTFAYRPDPAVNFQSTENLAESLMCGGSRLVAFRAKGWIAVAELVIDI